jgi:HNH endonuclease
MTVARADFELVRTRAGFACEYCGVTETDCGGPLTVDHHCPQALGGRDGPDNLVYCCWRCNLHKAAYWPTKSTDPVLWNPRDDSRDHHLLLLADGRLYARTPTGEFTLARLRLNRPALVAHRARRLSQVAEQGLLERYRDLLTLLEQMQQRHAELLEDHRALLQEQRDLIRLLTSMNT